MEIVARVERSGTRGIVTLPTKSPAFRKLHAGYLLGFVPGIVNYVEFLLFICLKYKAKKSKTYRKLTMPVPQPSVRYAVILK